MADSTKSLLRGLFLSAQEVRALNPQWSQAMTEDYLTLFDNLVTIAKVVDETVVAKLEDLETDFLDGSIPYVNDGSLAENNGRLFWDSANIILKIIGRIQSSGRLKGTTVVTNSMSPYTILSTDETIVADTDTGAITLLLQSGIEKTAYRIVNGGTSDNDLTVTPSGVDLLFGENDSEAFIDLEHIDIQYTSKGWI